VYGVVAIPKGSYALYTLCLLHKLAKKRVVIIADRGMDRNFRYARQERLSRKAVRPFSTERPYPRDEFLPAIKRGVGSGLPVSIDQGLLWGEKSYRASSKICKGCPLHSTCLGKVNEKQFSVTYYRAEYERNIERVNSPQGRYMKGKRQSTVEPVFGTLTQFMGLRKINTIGLAQANKVMHLSAIAYNLKKYLKFVRKRSKSGAVTLALPASAKSILDRLLSGFTRYPKLAAYLT